MAKLGLRTQCQICIYGFASSYLMANIASKAGSNCIQYITTVCKSGDDNLAFMQKKVKEWYACLNPLCGLQNTEVNCTVYKEVCIGIKCCS